MKRYIGSRSGGFVLVNNKSLRHIVRHSPTGLEWGYSGSGPADLALSILADCVGIEKANQHYQQFKWDVIAGFGEDWVVTEDEVREWLKQQEVKGEQEIMSGT